jgi:hypothetical protein
MSMRLGKILAVCLIFVMSAPAWADKTIDPCPPIHPKPDPMQLARAMASASTPEEMRGVMAPYSREIKEPATWSGCHVIWDTLKIEAPVSVSAGTVLKFKANAGLKIEQNGSLDAVGTADQPVTFTATDETPGYWYGIYYDSRSSHNRLIHAKVLYAGGTTVGSRTGTTLRRAGGDNNPPSRAVYVKKGALLSVKHSRIAFSKGYGLESLGSLGTFSDNQLDHNRVPMRIRLDNAGRLAASNKFADNDKQRLELIGNQTLTRDSTWHDMGIPYYLRFFVTVSANLKLDPGVTLLMEHANMVIEENGSLNAVGTADKPIVIRGAAQKPGYWGGLDLSSDSPKNVFKYVTVADGGRDNSSHDAANIRVGNHASLSVEHSRIEDSAGYGAYIQGDLVDFSNNVVKGNKIPLRVAMNSIGSLAASNKIADNQKQWIETMGTGDYLSRDATWRNLGAPYKLRYLKSVKANLKLMPGVVLLMGGGAGLDVESGGSLLAVGTADNPIVIRGVEEKAGYWRGLRISSHSKKNRLAYVKVADAGGGSGPAISNIEVAGWLDLKHCRIENSAGAGVVVHAHMSNPARLTASDNQFKDIKTEHIKKL